MFQINLDRIAHHLATRGFGIHIFPGQHRINGSPRRYKGFLKWNVQTIVSTGSLPRHKQHLNIKGWRIASLNWLATSIQVVLKFICLKSVQNEWLATSLQRFFESICFQVSKDWMARHLATQDFWKWFVKARARTCSPPRHCLLYTSDAADE